MDKEINAKFRKLFKTNFAGEIFVRIAEMRDWTARHIRPLRAPLVSPLGVAMPSSLADIQTNWNAKWKR